MDAKSVVVTRPQIGDELPQKQGLYDPAFERDACGVGFVADLLRRESHQTLADSLTILMGMEHRGATGCECETGDGAGVLTAMPHGLMQALAEETFGRRGLERGRYAVGNVFLSKDDDARARAKACFEDAAATSLTPLRVLGWRRAPVDPSPLGATARQAEPCVEQVFVELGEGVEFDQRTFDAALYVARKRAEHAARKANLQAYFVSLSSKVICWKGMFTTAQLGVYYKDLTDPRYATHVAMVHSRFSTNTFPAWSRAHPYRFVCHNGEINTVKGNVNWMRAREGVFASSLLGKQLQECCPIVETCQSDSGRFDNVLELLVLAGRSLPEAVAMMVPGAWQNSPSLSEECRAMYKCFSSVMEPWDGPALIAFTDGDVLGLTLDRNGLRPCRYVETRDGRIVGGSEAGAIQIRPEDILRRGRLQPGKMLICDMLKEHRIIPDEEFKNGLVARMDWSELLRANTLSLAGSEPAAPRLTRGQSRAELLRLLHGFGYSTEGCELLLGPMAYGEEALGSMGNDVALACLSKLPRFPYDFFQQLFAQVTNPPIDPIREGIVMSLACFVGPEHNLLEEDMCPKHVQRLYLESPILDLQTLDAFTLPARLPDPGSLPSSPLHGRHLKPTVIDITYPRADGKAGLKVSLLRICEEAAAAIALGAEVLILSDRAVSVERVQVSGLLAVAAVHAHLVKSRQRLRCGLVLESAEPHEVHHFCVLFGYGCDAVCPYGAFAALHNLRQDGKLPADMSDEKIIKGYCYAVGKGVKKVMSKMGVSCLQSYKGAQIFEALGLSDEVIELCFPGTASRISGATFARLARDQLAFHARGYGAGDELPDYLGTQGQYHYRNPTTTAGPTESHINDPDSIANLQDAARNDSRTAYAKFSAAHSEQVKRCALRGKLALRSAKEVGRQAIDVDEVEPAANIVKRFRTGAMSYGSISMEAHSTLAVAMNRLGGKSNTGEGGEDPERYMELLPSGDSARSSIKQVASGRFGVTIEYLVNADELQIKMAQGAKPGEGGELPGHKVDEKIAKTRHSTPGVGLISPPPHHDIYSIEDLAQLIFDLHSASDGGNVSVKLVSEAGVGVVAAGVAKAKADHILISGHDGGTGASRWTGIKHAGLPWELGIAETHQTLVLNGLRGRVTLETDGNLRNGKDIVIGALLGAEYFGLATAPLIAMGCIMMRKCHLNTCPVGIATQDPELRKKFEGQPEHVMNYLMLLAEEVRTHLAKLGFKTLDEAVGHAECLQGVDEEEEDEGAVDLTHLATNAADLPHAGKIGVVESRRLYPQDHAMEGILDRQLLVAAEASLANFGVRTECLDLKITNIDRSVGTVLSHHLTKAFYPRTLVEGTVHFKFTGSAGQSFGAFACPGVTLEVEGEANDYVGKGLSGGIVVVYPPSPLISHEHTIAGNVCLYGATKGRAFLAGSAAERFCVRNSGALAVVEGVGDHGCEYMTGGRVVVLGPVGVNFAAGMSGGIAYVWDPEGRMPILCNHEMVDLDKAAAWWDGDEAELRSLIEEHTQRTGSARAKDLLADWTAALPQFVKVFPKDLRQVLEKARKKAELGVRQDLEPPPAAPKKVPLAGAAGKDLEDLAGLAAKLKQKPATVAVSEGEESESTTDSSHSGSESEKNRPDRVEKPAKTRGFITYERADIKYREPEERARDFIEITNVPRDDRTIQTQAARCMDCGVPFCHQSTSGCPLGNLIPEWNELAFKGDWAGALERLLSTNNFPEFTGRVCPAPCEGACVLGIIEKPVSIKSIEVTIIDKAWELGLMVPRPPKVRSGFKVAVIGSGPAGLAAADELNRTYGHSVTVFERADRVGGLMMYGVPNMKADKALVVQRRVGLMAAEGVEFRTNTNFGSAAWLASAVTPEAATPAPSAPELMADYDAVLLATGATAARDLNIPGRQLPGVHLAMEYLHHNTKELLDAECTDGAWREKVEAKQPSPAWIDVKGKHVIVIGGGDTGNDCIGTAIRQGCANLVNFEIMPMPGKGRDHQENPWPQWPRIYRVDYGHKEAKAKQGKDPREFLINAKEFIEENGRLSGVRTVRVEWTFDTQGRRMPQEVPGSEETWPCDYCFLAMGFLGPERTPAEALGVQLDARSNYAAAFGNHATNIEKVFAAGDCRRGQSLVVWAIAEGRRAAQSINTFLQGRPQGK